MKYTITEREIIWKDMLLDWCGHWRSILALVLVTVFFLLSYKYMFNGLFHEGNKDEGSQENELITEGEIKEVNDLVEMNRQYETLISHYKTNTDVVDLEEWGSVLSQLASIKYSILVSLNNYFSTAQKAEYYKEIGVIESNTETKTSGRNIKGLLIVFFLIIVHFIVFAYLYISDNRLKYTDRVSEIMGIRSFVLIRDQESGKRLFQIDRFIHDLRVNDYRKLQFSEAMEWVSYQFVQSLMGAGYRKVAFIGENITEEIGALSSKMKTDMIKKGYEIDMCNIENVKYSISGSEIEENCDAVVVVAKVAMTEYSKLLEELQWLKDINSNIIGLVIFA